MQTVKKNKLPLLTSCEEKLAIRNHNAFQSLYHIIYYIPIYLEGERGVAWWNDVVALFFNSNYIIYQSYQSIFIFKHTQKTAPFLLISLK